MRNSRRVTIREVAEACGVSPMTVSYVLNGKRDKVGPDTSARVLKAVRDLNYTPPSLSASPKHALETVTLGIVSDVPSAYLMDTSGGYVNAILGGILKHADDLQHNITLFSQRLLHADIHRSIRVYCDGRCDGLIVFSPIRDSPLINALLERGTPFVTIGNIPLDTRVSGVDVDDIAIGEMAGGYLADQGHRRIAFVNAHPCVESSNRRQQGCYQALRARGLAVPVRDFIPWDDYKGRRDISAETLCHNAVIAAFNRPSEERPTALCCFNDQFAFFCMDTLHSLGLRVPEDVSVIGVDDVLAAAGGDRQLSTIRQPYAQIGTQTVDILLTLISEGSATPVRTLLPAEMVIRRSVGPPA